MHTSKVEQAQIVAAAFALLDETGLEGLTLRRLASALKIKAPSLYWHFANKQALIDGLADALVADVTANIGAAQTWEDGVRQVSAQFRQALLRHRDGARIFAGTYIVSDNVLRISETSIGLFLRSGVDVTLATSCSFSLAYYVLGFVIEEQALAPESGVDVTAVKASFLKLAGEKYPHSWEARNALFSTDFDGRFNIGVEIIIAGVKGRANAFLSSDLATSKVQDEIPPRRSPNTRSRN